MMMAADFSAAALRPEGIYPPFSSTSSDSSFSWRENRRGVSAILGPVRPSTVPVFGHETYLLLARASVGRCRRGHRCDRVPTGPKTRWTGRAPPPTILLALSPLHVNDSHFAVPDTTMVFGRPCSCSRPPRQWKEVGRVVRPDGILPRTRDARRSTTPSFCTLSRGRRTRPRRGGLPDPPVSLGPGLLFLHAGLAAGLFAGSPTSFWSSAGSVRSC